MNKFIFELWTKYLPAVIGLLLTVSVTSCVYDDKAADCDNVILRFIYYADGEENVIQDYRMALMSIFSTGRANWWPKLI